jgi:hypothetical protein
LPPAFDGALLHVGKDSDMHSRIADVTPGSRELDFEDAALAPGAPWFDPYSGLGLSVQHVGADLAVDVTYGAAQCVPAIPTVTIAPAGSVAGATASLPITVTNTDAGTCPPLQAMTVIRTSAPGGWAAATIPVAVAPQGGAGATTMSQPVPADTLAGSYTVSVASPRGSGTSAAASATISVLPAVSVAVPAAPVVAGSTVGLTATIRDGGNPAASVSVTFTLVRPNGSKVTSTRATNAAGVATWSYQVSSRGTYTLTAKATINNKTGTSSPATFAVQ